MPVATQDLSPTLGLDYLDRLDVVLWIYDIDEKRVVWANRAGLRIWNAETMAELRARDLSADMSLSVAQRLRQYQEDFIHRDATFREAWTIYPKGQPRMLRVAYRGYRLPDGRMAMLCEGTEEISATPEAMRSVEALLHTSVIISLLTVSGRMLYCNPAARACYGGDADVLDRRFEEAADAKRVLDAIATCGMFEGAVPVATVHGQRWHQIKAFLCQDAVTGEQAMLVSETDVTETHRARLELVASRNAAVEASRLKTEFVANMSHEIRTPLNGVLGLAQLMRNTDLSNEQADLLTMIESSGKALLGIIEDILDFSKIEAGELQLHPEPFSLHGLLQEVEDTIFVAASNKGIAVQRHMDADVPATVNGDPKRLRQVLINLLSNAVKFSHDRDVDLSIERAGENHLRFTVVDHGIGIPAHQLATVFERFRQADGSLSRRHGGTGLGLAICKMLVEMMDGEIGVESVEGNGSRFWFTAMLSTAKEPLSKRPPGTIAGSAEGLRVLLAEDNPTNQFIIARSLERHGIDVDVVGNGAEALESLKKHDYAVVLMDLQMPVLSGQTAIERIRAGGVRSVTVPIVALTANATPEAMKAVLDVGADAYMTKPVNLDALYKAVLDMAQVAARRHGDDHRRRADRHRIS